MAVLLGTSGIQLCPEPTGRIPLEWDFTKDLSASKSSGVCTCAFEGGSDLDQFCQFDVVVSVIVIRGFYRALLSRR